MQRNEDILVLLEPKPVRRPHLSCLIKVIDQRIDHHIPDAPDLFPEDSLLEEILVRIGRRRQEKTT